MFFFVYLFFQTIQWHEVGWATVDRQVLGGGGVLKKVKK